MGNNPAQVLIDTGSALTLVRTEYWNQTPTTAQQLQSVSQPLVGVDGTPLAAQGTATVEVVLGNQRFSVPVTVMDDITTDIILGVRNWPTPPNKFAVQQFLGLASYYRRFVPDFASIAQPLHRLTEKTVPFVWNEGCQQAFKELKERLTTTLILALPDFSCTFLLDTDASDHGTGAVLSQVAADVLSKLEHNYCVTRHGF